jgi:hypothetical protein
MPHIQLSFLLGLPPDELSRMVVVDQTEAPDEIFELAIIEFSAFGLAPEELRDVFEARTE